MARPCILADEQIEENGTLTIIDRVKHLVRDSCAIHSVPVADQQIKLQNGEYLALDKVESVYKACGTLIRYDPVTRADLRCDNDDRPRCSIVRLTARRDRLPSTSRPLRAPSNVLIRSTRVICAITSKRLVSPQTVRRVTG